MLTKFKWQNLSIGWKYSTALITTIVLFMLASAVIFVLLGSMRDNINAMDERSERAVNFTEMISLFRAKDTRIADYILTKDHALLQEYQAHRNDFTALQDTMEPLMTTDEQVKLFKQIQANDQETDTIFFDSIIPAVERADNVQVLLQRDNLVKLRAETNHHLTELKNIVDAEHRSAVRNAVHASGSAVWTLLLSVAIAAVLGAITLWFVNRRIQRNLHQVVDVSKEIADGNLAVDTISYDGKDEIGQLALGFNTMRGHLRTMIEQIQDIAEKVNRQSEGLTDSSQQVTTGAEQIASTMGDLSAGAEEQAGASSEISSFVRDLNKQIHVTNEDSETLAHSSRDVFNMSREGMEQMEVSVQQMNDITALVTDTADKVQGLDRRSAEISKLVEVIEGIADQTNLLALNAAIEAARAGEAGRGFSVVAEEVKKLAEQVGYSVSDITSIIEGIQEETKTVVHSLQKGHEKTEAGNEQITTSLEYFTSINDSISDMRGRIQNIATSLTDIASNSEKVTQSADEISANSEETAAGIEQSSATAQQQSSSMQEVAGSAETLSRLAVDLNDLVRTFRLS